MADQKNTVVTHRVIHSRENGGGKKYHTTCGVGFTTKGDNIAVALNYVPQDSQPVRMLVVPATKKGEVGPLVSAATPTKETFSHRIVASRINGKGERRYTSLGVGFTVKGGFLSLVMNYLPLDGQFLIVDAKSLEATEAASATEVEAPAVPA